jgi:hypothetical protein
MECHLSLLNRTKIDRAKNQQSFASFVYKNANKNTQHQKGRFFRSAAESGCFYVYAFQPQAMLAGKKTYPEQKTYLKRYVFGYVFSFAPNPGPPRDVYCGPEISSYLVQYFHPTTTFHHKNCSILTDVDNVNNDSSSSLKTP